MLIKGISNYTDGRKSISRQNHIIILRKLDFIMDEINDRYLTFHLYFNQN